MGCFENGGQEVAMEERAWESGHIQLKYILFPPKTRSSRNTSADRESGVPLQNTIPEPSVLQGATVVIGDRLCSSDWDTEAILLKDFKDIKLTSKITICQQQTALRM